MLEPVRDEAMALARATDPPLGRDAFLRWAGDLAAQQAGLSRGPGQLEAVARVGAEYPNLRAALSAHLAARDPRAVDLAVSLCPYWDARSLLHEARRHLEPAAAIGAPG